LKVSATSCNARDISLSVRRFDAEHHSTLKKTCKVTVGLPPKSLKNPVAILMVLGSCFYDGFTDTLPSIRPFLCDVPTLEVPSGGIEIAYF
jgi:hypothetical protein